MASPIWLNKPGLNNFNDLRNKILGEPLPGQIMEISTVIIRPGRGSPGNLGNGGKFKLGTLPAMFSSLIGLAK